MVNDTYAIIYNDGNLTLRDFKKECHKERWIPLLVLRERDGKITIPLFNNLQIAHKCMRRNIPRNVKSGIVELVDEDTENMRKRGWNLEVMSHPRKFTNHPQYSIDFEIYEMVGETDFGYYW
ncbi:hypothetical protein J4221_06600 [Candidatus Pacearchaeota archaeon]|nr:hypothetical protein [Candidatus Pacearchaeota archaeon]